VPACLQTRPAQTLRMAAIAIVGGVRTEVLVSFRERSNSMVDGLNLVRERPHRPAPRSGADAEIVDESTR
jgi:hypothetical protein